MATDAAGLVRLGSLGEVVPLAAEASPAATPGRSSGPVASARLGGPFSAADGGWLGLAGLILVSAISLVVTVARRRRAHRRLAAVVAAAGLADRSVVHPFGHA